MRLREVWRFGVVMTLGVVVAAWSDPTRCAEPPVNEHNLVVSRDRAYVNMNFSVIQQEQAARLNTKPAQGQEFIPGTGRVLDAMRHGDAVWVETKDDATLHTAQCPRVPANTPSHIICTGYFKPEAGAQTAVQNAPGGGAGRVVGPVWRSELNEPGAHVIVANLYNTARDTGAGTAGVSQNQCVDLSARALRDMYAAAGGDRVVLATCGVGQTNIARISDLPAYLAGLQPAVQNGSVITFDTLGHGRQWDINDKVVRVMLCARRAPRDAMDVVGRPGDYATVIEQPEVVLGIADYAPIIRPMLKDRASVNLMHCYTAESYKSPDPQVVDTVPSVAAQLNAALPENVRVAGVKGTCSFPYRFTDVNDNGHYDAGEPITGWVPGPNPDGGSWEVYP